MKFRKLLFQPKCIDYKLIKLAHIRLGIDQGPGPGWGCQFLPQTGPGRGDYQKWPGPGIIKQTINLTVLEF